MKEDINTNTRLFDLVRYMRAELHDADLITDAEYAWLTIDAEMAKSPEGGSPSPRRLEDYDYLKANMIALERQLKNSQGENRLLWKQNVKLRDALLVLPLDEFKDDSNLDAAQFVDNSRVFLEAMNTARELLGLEQE